MYALRQFRQILSCAFAVIFTVQYPQSMARQLRQLLPLFCDTQAISKYRLL
jgi:hypothetical protein